MTLQNEINSNLDNYDLKFEYRSEPSSDSKEEMIHIFIENLFEACYELDENEQPNRFKLKNLDKIFRNYDAKNLLFQKCWSKIEKKLGDVLRIAAQFCLDKGTLNRMQHERFFVSVTEKEIFNGILGKAKNPACNALYFQRDIDDLQNVRIDESNSSLIKKFVDLDNQKTIDQSAKNLLDKLKNEKIPSRLPDTNIFKFRVKWCHKTGISMQSHSEYIRRFGEVFFFRISM